MFQPDCVLPGQRLLVSSRPCSPASSQSHRIAQEEIFGPVLSIMSFRTPDEAVEKANNTPYGLSAGVWTSKGSRILWMADRLQAGVVWANTYNKFDPASPFGGYKESGFGREGGRHGLLSYLKGIWESRWADSTSARPTSSTSTASSPAPSRAAPIRPSMPTGRCWPGWRWAPARTCARRCGRPGPRRGNGPGSGYNRGQVLYRIAEMIEDRRGPSSSNSQDGRRQARRRGSNEVADSIDRMVWYAGWADKFAQIYGNLNPVAGPFFNISAPEPTGVVGVIAPEEPSLLGLVSRLAPVMVTGQHGGGARLRDASRCRRSPWPRPWNSSDVPGGVVNILTGQPGRTGPWLADHMDVNAVDAGWGHAGPGLRMEQGAVHNVKRLVVHRRRPGGPDPLPDRRLHRDQDRLAPQGPLEASRPKTPEPVVYPPP